MKIAGLDIGTTDCKCTAFDEQGKYLDKAYRNYPIKRGVGGHENDISGIGATSFGKTFVCADEVGNPLHAAML